jgi:hypothetical protein
MLVTLGGVWTLRSLDSFTNRQFRLWFSERGSERNWRIVRAAHVLVAVFLVGFGLLLIIFGIASGNWLGW